MRSHRLWRALSERRGEGYVDVIVLVLCAVMVLALASDFYSETAVGYLRYRTGA